MKKYFTMCLIIGMILAVVACGSADNDNAVILENPDSASAAETTDSAVKNEDSKDEGNGSQSSAADNESRSNGNILVAFFSRVGNTEWEDGVDAVTSASLNVENGAFIGNAEYLAKMAAEVTGGDLFLIQTEETYPSDYRETTNVASAEQSDNARPALASHVENMGQYDSVILIYPNWWGNLPMPLYTFLEEYDFGGKTILPLCTHEGSRMGSSEKAIAELCPDAILLGCSCCLFFTMSLTITGAGIVLSRHALSFLPISGGQSWARTLHMLCAYWGFVIISLHLGLHWSMMMGMAKRIFKKPSAAHKWIVRGIGALIACYGVYAFIKRQIGSYMFLVNQFAFFDYEEPLILFLTDYITVMGLFVFIGHYLTEALRRS